jgi:hypothetical protein
MVIFAIISSVVLAHKMSWGDNMNLVNESIISYLVVMVDGKMLILYVRWS